jgi:HSP20 family protein
MAITRFISRPSLFPTPLLDDMPDRLRRMFEGGLNLEPLTEPLGWMPAMEIVENDDAFVVTAEVPGINAKDVDISIDDGVLTLSGEKKEEKEEGKEGSKFHMWERRYGSFRRSFTLPQAVEADKISAKATDGILTVTLPKTKKAKAQGRKIPVTNGR